MKFGVIVTQYCITITTCINSFSSPNNPIRGTIMIPVLQMKKLRPINAGQYAQSYRMSKW